MLRSAEDLTGYKILASDGEFGRADDFYFTDRRWEVEYLVVKTGNWLTGHRVLLPPEVLGSPDWEQHQIPVALPADWIKSSPDAIEEMPVSRQKMIEALNNRGWITPPMKPHHVNPMAVEAAAEKAEKERGEDIDRPFESDSHLRSANEVNGYKIEAVDGDIGHVEDFIVDDDTWDIRYLVIDTRNWLPGGKKVLISPRWIDDIRWENHEVKVDLPQEKIKDSPEFDPHMPVNREYEARLYDFYGRPKYW